MVDACRARWILSGLALRSTGLAVEACTPCQRRGVASSLQGSLWRRHDTSVVQQYCTSADSVGNDDQTHESLRSASIRYSRT